MEAIVVLFVAGLLMIALEVFLPGAVLGIAGGLCIGIGCYVAFRDYGAGGGAMAIAAATVLIAVTLFIEFRILRRTRLARGMFLSAQITGVSSSAPEAGLVGQRCTAVTALAPSGVVLLAGKRYEAFSRDGFVPRGSTLVVRGSDNFRLIVSKES